MEKILTTLCLMEFKTQLKMIPTILCIMKLKTQLKMTPTILCVMMLKVNPLKMKKSPTTNSPTMFKIRYIVFES